MVFSFPRNYGDTGIKMKMLGSLTLNPTLYNESQFDKDTFCESSWPKADRPNLGL